MAERYTVERRTARLEFEDYPGAWARCVLDIGLGEFFEFQKVDSSDVDALRAIHQRFGDDILIEWNLDIDGAELPATGEGFMLLPPILIRSIIQAWSEAVQGIAGPLGSGSQNGHSSPAASTRKVTRLRSR